MLLDHTRKRLHLLRIQRRDGPIGHASGSPLDEVVALARYRGLWPSRSWCGWPDKQNNHMLLVLVHQRRDGAIVEVIETPPDQRKPLRRQIRDGWGEIHLALKPWLHCML